MYGLIDADILVFRAAFAAQKNQWFLSVGEAPPEMFAYKKEAIKRLDEQLPGIHSRVEGQDYRLWSERFLEPVENALQNCKSQMKTIMDKLQLNEWDVTCYLSGGVNYRYAIAKTRPYKGNRDNVDRPAHEEAVRNFIKSKWNTVVTDGIEADDALGTEQISRGRNNSVIISIDKDLDMIPGFHYNLMHDILYEVTEDDAMRKFFTQLLTGDPTDNIVGLKGIGGMKAEKILEGLTLDECRDEVVRQYACNSGVEDWFAYLNEMAALLWIQREKNVIYQFSDRDMELGGDGGQEIPDLEMY